MQSKLGGVVNGSTKTIPQSASLTAPFTQGILKGAFEKLHLNLMCRNMDMSKIVERRNDYGEYRKFN